MDNNIRHFTYFCLYLELTCWKCIHYSQHCSWTYYSCCGNQRERKTPEFLSYMCIS